MFLFRRVEKERPCEEVTDGLEVVFQQIQKQYSDESEDVQEVFHAGAQHFCKFASHLPLSKYELMGASCMRVLMIPVGSEN